ncbi:MAG: permease [Deltaproteobacteria bacterium]|jgi:cell division transport system permease protein|nr:permease [Deltaproteobacteria bacterium]
MMRIFLRLIGQGVMGLCINPWAQILTLSAVVLVSFLVGLFLMAITTLDYQLSMVKGETSFLIYWKSGQNQEEITEQWKDINHLPGFLFSKTYTPEEALKEMETLLGHTATPRNFAFLAENNPLPATAQVTFSPGTQEYESWLKETSQYLWNLPGVERVVVTPLRDELGQAWRTVNTYVMRPVILFLTILLGLVVGNTVRLAFLGKAHEIEILQIVGAFNWYIRLPLLVCGAVQGLAGSALALVILRFIHLQIRDVLNFPPLMMEIQFLTPEITVLMLAIPTLMGVLGGWVGMKHL